MQLVEAGAVILRLGKRGDQAHAVVILGGDTAGGGETIQRALHREHDVTLQTGDLVAVETHPELAGAVELHLSLIHICAYERDVDLPVSAPLSSMPTNEDAVKFRLSLELDVYKRQPLLGAAVFCVMALLFRYGMSSTLTGCQILAPQLINTTI